MAANAELQWSELYYRGYFELQISQDAVQALFFGIPTTRVRSGREISLANFTVRSGENALARDGAGGSEGFKPVENGALKFGQRVMTNVTYDTGSGGRPVGV